MQSKRCFFIGTDKIDKHKKKKLERKLLVIINQLVEKGVKEFYTVADLGFEILAARCVAEVKRENDNIILYIKLPIREKLAISKNLEEIKIVCAIADSISPYENYYSDPNYYFPYYVYTRAVDVVVMCKGRNIFMSNKDSLIKTMEKKLISAKKEIIYI